MTDNPWIAISERLPEANQQCLVTEAGHYVVLRGTFKRRNNDPIGEPDGWILGLLEEFVGLDAGMTHWCPEEILPAVEERHDD